MAKCSFCKKDFSFWKAYSVDGKEYCPDCYNLKKQKITQKIEEKEVKKKEKKECKKTERKKFLSEYSEAYKYCKKMEENGDFDKPKFIPKFLFPKKDNSLEGFRKEINKFPSRIWINVRFSNTEKDMQQLILEKKILGGGTNIDQEINESLDHFKRKAEYILLKKFLDIKKEFKSFNLTIEEYNKIKLKADKFILKSGSERISDAWAKINLEHFYDQIKKELPNLEKQLSKGEKKQFNHFFELVGKNSIEQNIIEFYNNFVKEYNRGAKIESWAFPTNNQLVIIKN